ncbi:phosphatidylglycerol lysyltransferase [Litoreibacter ponti]|uniref:Phosphatidylglycerol lysyltransferase n=2 Tax=Litoreibacter ponti TaxID=1510457 RepID=A0A2T6BI45_9RHOB|nr:phosphatidylglycerol lysyltransferase [Litoreibacter ponti]
MDPARRRLWQGLRQAGLVAASGAALWLLARELAEVDPAAVLTLVAHFPPLVWASAALFTAISLMAVGGYDVAVARWMGLPLRRRDAFAIGWKATAIAQTLGFGLFTGALVRWRLLGQESGLNLWQATKITMTVTACFFGGWVIVASIAALCAPDLPPRLWWLGALGLWAGLCFLVLCLRKSHLNTLPLPPLRMSAQVVALTVVDTLAAATVIYVFLPESYTPFMTLYVAFLVAFAVGMISTVPGGVGPFELCLVTLLAPADPTPLLAACLGYRAIYYLAPALIAGACLIAPRKIATVTRSVLPESEASPHRAGLVEQGQLSVLTVPGGAALGRQTTNSELILFDPVGDASAFMEDRLTQARARFRRLVLYKFSGETARASRSLGFQTHRVGRAAVLDPAVFTLQGPDRAELRRKLRKAEKAGVKVVDGLPHWKHLHDIDATWQARNGAPLGFSMGRLNRRMVARQKIYTACLDAAPVAFVTFHHDGGRWTLDLMRSSDAAPDGTMHALIAHAAMDAKSKGIRCLSLCSVPFLIDGTAASWVERGFKWFYERQTFSKGLCRFKSSFAPDWRDEWIAAPSTASLMLGAFEIYRLIHEDTDPEDMHTLQDHYDLYEFASN